jgi:hypothetical protein
MTAREKLAVLVGALIVAAGRGSSEKEKFRQGCTMGESIESSERGNVGDEKSCGS